jgi:hypothetical protein
VKTFLEYVDKKERESKRHLKIIANLLENSGMKVKKHLGEDAPYLFVPSPQKKLSFDGIRIYKIGSHIAYRVQKNEKTQPYGKSYPLDIEDMFKDYISDHMDEDKAGGLVVRSVIKEIKHFFKKSHEAEKDLMQADFDVNDPLGRVVVKSTGTDWSNQVANRT